MENGCTYLDSIVFDIAVLLNGNHINVPLCIRITILNDAFPEPALIVRKTTKKSGLAAGLLRAEKSRDKNNPTSVFILI